MAYVTKDLRISISKINTSKNKYVEKKFNLHNKVSLNNML